MDVFILLSLVYIYFRESGLISPPQTVFLPGETPAMAMGYPYEAIKREMDRMRTAHPYITEELEEMIVYKKGKGPERYVLTAI